MSRDVYLVVARDRATFELWARGRLKRSEIQGFYVDADGRHYYYAQRSSDLHGREFAGVIRLHDWWRSDAAKTGFGQKLIDSLPEPDDVA